MNFVRVRYLIFLALVYLVLVSLPHHYLWQARTLDRLFEMPGGSAGARRKHRDVYNYDYPADLDEVGDPGNKFRRNPAPHGVTMDSGDMNSSSVHSINSSSSVRSVSSSATLPKESLQTRMSIDTGLNNVTFPKPNPCLHAFYYGWYEHMETDGC